MPRNPPATENRLCVFGPSIWKRCPSTVVRLSPPAWLRVATKECACGSPFHQLRGLGSRFARSHPKMPTVGAEFQKRSVGNVPCRKSRNERGWKPVCLASCFSCVPRGLEHDLLLIRY